MASAGESAAPAPKRTHVVRRVTPSSTNSSRSSATTSSAGKLDRDSHHGQEAQPTALASSILHIFVSGKVQGVFFRKYTHAECIKLNLHGWVRNLDDGRVEVLAQGPGAVLDALLAWLPKGSPKSKVSAVDVAARWSTFAEVPPELVAVSGTKKSNVTGLGPFTIVRGGAD